MAEFKGDEFRFPDEKDASQDAQVAEKVTTAADDEVDVEIIDDTPDRDRGRKPLDKEVVDPTDDEIETYSDKEIGRAHV